MKILEAVVVVVAILLAGRCLADDFKTTNGTVYKGVTVTRTEPDGIVVMTDDGIIKIPFTSLAADVQKKYGYNPGTAGQYSAALAQAQHQAFVRGTAEMQASENQKTAELQKVSDERKLKQLAANIPSVNAHLRVLSVTDGGVLAFLSTYSQVDTEEQHGETSVPVTKTVRSDESDDPVFVYGVTAAVDGSETDSLIYPCGTYQYNSAGGAAKTVKAYATSANQALAVIAGQP